jgi:hypothetical protein
MDVRVEGQQVAEGLNEQDQARTTSHPGAGIGPDQQSLHDMAQLPEQSALAGENRSQHPRYGEDLLPMRHRSQHVLLDPIPIGEHALLVTARAEIPRLTRKRKQVIVTAFGAIHAREPVVRITAFEKALDDALFEQPLQTPLGSQFHQVAIGALIEGARARLTLAIHAAFGRSGIGRVRQSSDWIPPIERAGGTITPLLSPRTKTSKWPSRFPE